MAIAVACPCQSVVSLVWSLLHADLAMCCGTVTRMRRLGIAMSLISYYPQDPPDQRANEVPERLTHGAMTKHALFFDAVRAAIQDNNVGHAMSKFPPTPSAFSHRGFRIAAEARPSSDHPVAPRHPQHVAITRRSPLLASRGRPGRGTLNLACKATMRRSAG